MRFPHALAALTAATLTVALPALPAHAGTTAAGFPATSAFPVTSAAPDSSAVLLIAGDVANCADHSTQTAAIILNQAGTVAVAGDAANKDPNSLAQYQRCYGPTWGRFKDRTHPVPGNHDYLTPGATPYFTYFGAAAGPAGLGYYSYDLGTWHIVALNSECRDIPGGCGPTSPEGTWLRADLAAHPSLCTLAYYHRPLFSSALVNSDQPQVFPLYQILYDAHAEIVVNAHAHLYERFAPQTPTGAASSLGIREFVVGTGGIGLHRFAPTPRPNSQVRDNSTWGVLRLTLRVGGYAWRFLPIAGQSFTDAGSGTCH